MMGAGKVTGEVIFDKNIKGVDPEAVHKVKLASGAVMPIAGFGTFHSDWAQAYMKDATVEAITGWLAASRYRPGL